MHTDGERADREQDCDNIYPIENHATAKPPGDVLGTLHLLRLLSGGDDFGTMRCAQDDDSGLSELFRVRCTDRCLTGSDSPV